MAKEKDPTTGTNVPDTATSYERAKPEKESPSGTLEQPPTQPPEQQDELARSAQPRSPKKMVAGESSNAG